MENGLSQHDCNLLCVCLTTITLRRATAHLERLEGASACDEVAAIIQPSNSVVFDPLTVSQRKRECILLTRAGPDQESATGVA